jgi:UDP-GlcNAc:undecaprenyl-phosphate GlcNAc-1-phosphate transferase
MIMLTTLLISLFITMVLIPLFKNYAVQLQAMDFPNGRSVHTYPKPKVGGIAMTVGLLVPVLLWSSKDSFSASVVIGSLIVVILGFADDRHCLDYKSKFVGQIIAALVVILHGGLMIRSLGILLPQNVLLPDWVALPLTLLVIVGVTNAINLSDGLDGLAGGISLLSFCGIAFLAYQSGQHSVAVISVATVGAIFAFLRFNTYPAVIFMGDAGSLLLGFLAATLSLKLTQGKSPVSPLFPLILLGLPIMDTLTVMLERLAKGKSPFVADKKHFHHKLMKLGFQHQEAVFAIYILQGSLVIFAYVFRFYSEWFLIAFYLTFSSSLMVWTYAATKSGWQLRRGRLVEKTLKLGLSRLIDRIVIVKTAYWFVLLGLPALLLFTCLVPYRIPAPFPILSLAAACLIFAVMLFRYRWLEKTLRLSIYYLVPLLVYQSQIQMVPWLDYQSEKIYNFSFLVLVAFVICMLKFTRRQNGFKTTPTDFLILFIALIVPSLPGAHLQDYRMGLFAAKLIALFFSYEVLIGELRGELNGLSLITIAALLVVYIRGIL